MDYFPGAPLAQTVYDRTYSRVKPDGTKETWPETVTRVVDGNLGLVDPKHIEPGERDALIASIMDRKFLPAGRHLWMSGVEGRNFLFNCHRAGWGTLTDHVEFVFNELMKGGGIGANYSLRYLTHMPRVRSRVRVKFFCDPSHPDFEELSPYCSYGTGLGWRVADSREGWVDALKVLVKQATSGKLNSELTIVYDISGVRPKGSPIRTFGGTASGPLPLVKMLEEFAWELERMLDAPYRALDLMKLDHIIAKCVISGNVRRSARMSMLHWNDPEIFDFIKLKADHADHWTTNISVEVDDEFWAEADQEGTRANNVLRAMTSAMLRNGEPGIYDSALASKGERGDVACTNPCGEIALEEWENCNLGHVNLAMFHHKEQRELRETFRLAARFLLRATFGKIEDPKQWGVMQKNRRIGVGFLGLQEFAARAGWRMSELPQTRMPLYLREWRETARSAATRYSIALGVATPVKTTCVAPTGSIAHLAGTTPGIQPVYSRYYDRRVRFAENDPMVEEYIDRGYRYEFSPHEENTVIVTFPTKDPMLDRVNPDLVEQANELDPEDALAVQAMVQTFYADNAISHTINVEPGTLTAERLAKLLLRFGGLVKGITIMVDESRPYAPLTRITEEEYLTTSLDAGDSLDDTELACAGGACPIR